MRLDIFHTFIIHLYFFFCHLFMSFAHFSIAELICFLLIGRRALWIKDINPLPVRGADTTINTSLKASCFRSLKFDSDFSNLSKLVTLSAWLLVHKAYSYSCLNLYLQFWSISLLSSEVC